MAVFFFVAEKLKIIYNIHVSFSPLFSFFSPFSFSAFSLLGGGEYIPVRQKTYENIFIIYIAFLLPTQHSSTQAITWKIIRY